MMDLVRFSRDGTSSQAGVLVDDVVRPLHRQFSELMSLHLSDIQQLTERRDEPSYPLADVRLLAPVDGLMEVWAAGVTYQRSRHARVAESKSGDIYLRVYESCRPELFFKALAWKVVTDGEPIGIRVDSRLNVPEPELALVVNAFGELVGYTICNDVSSRDIEGENPLYLPQAKVYAGSCALGSRVRPSWELQDVSDLRIAVEIRRGENIVWSGSTSTRLLVRKLSDLVSHLVEYDQFPWGFVLATGTGIAPEIGITMQAGDIVNISIEGVGELSNTVVEGKKDFQVLVQRAIRSIN
jgi:2-dehydro-3-deoxy-D-arabinonate dehydratase